MKLQDYPPKEFCKKAKCVHYNTIKRLEANLSPEQLLTDRDLGISRVTCQQRCEKTAYELNEWLRNNNPFSMKP